MKLLNLIAYLAIVDASTYNFKKWGADWPGIEMVGNMCGRRNQSPIDLKSSGWPTISSVDDGYQKMYTDPFDVEVKFNGHTSNVYIDREGQDLQAFYSSSSEDKYGGSKRFNGRQFYFHAGAEHTVDGLRHDLEMQVLHNAAKTVMEI